MMELVYVDSAEMVLMEYFARRRGKELVVRGSPYVNLLREVMEQGEYDHGKMLDRLNSDRIR